MNRTIGIVCPYSLSHPGGVQNHVLGLAGWLTAQGHRVHVLAPGRVSDAALHQHGLRAEQVQSAGPGLPVPWNGSVARVNWGPLALSSVLGWLRHSGCDLVHVHEPMTPSISLLAARFAQVPVVATFHTANAGSRAMALAQRIAPVASRRIAVGIAVSETARMVAHREGLVVIGNGIRSTDHQVVSTQTRWRGGEHPVLTFVGRYGEPRKGFGLLQAALDELFAVHPDLQVQVVGDGPRLGDPRLQVLGRVSDERRNELLASTDVYLAPNTGRESFGIVLLEALASGAPVVASDLPPFQDVLRDSQGVIGRLFRTGDARDLASNVLASLAEPRDLNLARGRARAAVHDWEVIGEQVLAQYDRALA